MFHNNVCYECLKPICHNCENENVMNGGTRLLKSCMTCAKMYCQDCVASTRCTSCSDYFCRGCGDLKECDECGDATCESCFNTCGGCNRIRCNHCAQICRCDGINCSKVHCQDCYNGKEYSVKYCGECDSEYCLECKVERVKKDPLMNGCRCCAADTVPLLVQQNARLTKEVKELKGKPR